MESKKKTIIPTGFFENPRKIITNKEALKDVIPVDWNKVLKGRKENENQIIKVIKKRTKTLN